MYAFVCRVITKLLCSPDNFQSSHMWLFSGYSIMLTSSIPQKVRSSDPNFYATLIHRANFGAFGVNSGI